VAVRVGVNGFGRIGMLFTKAAMDRGDIEVVAANDLMPFDSLANLFKHDSTHGIWHEDVSYDGNVLHVGDHEIKTFAERDPAQIPWGDVGADIVVESTGVFTSRDGAAAHIEGGAKKVIISAPGKGVDATFVYKVNHEDYDPEAHEIVSNASCTTNCIIPMVKVIQDNFGIESGYMTTVHAYTNDQSLLDAAHNFVARISSEASADDVNAAFQTAADGELSDILEYAEAPLVSSDIVGNKASCVFDSQLTMSNGGTVKVLGWYDNEWGYSNRTCDLAAYMGDRL
jgi:glyceraldehyde 3-phosphate dehydrogenase